MDGIHDLGGMVGFGPVTVEDAEPVFHEPWQATAFALNVAAIGVIRAYNADQYRHAVERMDPANYLAASYYERMLTGAATLLVELGYVPVDALEALAGGPFPLSRPVLDPSTVVTEPDAVVDAARFAVSDEVRVTARPTSGHTRCPRYVRGKVGVVALAYPLAELPELRAHSSARRREHTYAVRFACTDLWEDGDADQSVIVELFESYLQPSP